MMPATPPYAVNCSILLGELPLLARPAAARDAGFTAVEFWWPFADSTPSSAEVDSFVGAIESADVQLTGLNFDAGDMAGGDRGLFSWPARRLELRAGFDIITSIGERTGCRHFNALYGNRLAAVSADEQDALAAENLALAAEAVARIGGTVLVEPISGAPAYPLSTTADVIGVLDRLVLDHDVDNVAMLMDIYHLAVNGADVARDIAEHSHRVAHVQVADAPGRGAPGTGTLPIRSWVATLRDAGYMGPIGLEYRDGGSDPFAWIPLDERADRTP